MVTVLMRTVQMDETYASKIRELEDELGCSIVALEPLERFADLSEEKLLLLQTSEKKLGVILLACEPSKP